jgi:membrane dipeptidase
MRTITRKIISLAVLAAALIGTSAYASIESKTWDASDKAKKFVKDSIVIGFFASPYGAGWTKPEHLHNYLHASREAGITGHDMTLAATGFTFDMFIKENQIWRNTMAETPDKYIFVRSVRDIEAAHIQGKTAVIWNTQTASIIDGDLNKVATLKEMGVASMILSYNDLFRTGSGGLAEFNGDKTRLTSWGRSVLDQMVKHRIMVDLSHMGPIMTNDIMDYMDKKYPGVPYTYTHSLPAGLYKNTPNATQRGCYRNISDEEAVRAAKSGGFVSPTFTEWMMDGIWPEDITPQQAADMIDYYVKLVGVDHVGIASDDMFTTEPTMGFVERNPDAYADDGYMVNAFKKGATGCGELSKILAAVTDELWKRGYTNEDLKKIYGGNKMRVYKQIWENESPVQFNKDAAATEKLRNELKMRYMSR